MADLAADVQQSMERGVIRSRFRPLAELVRERNGTQEPSTTPEKRCWHYEQPPRHSHQRLYC